MLHDAPVMPSRIGEEFVFCPSLPIFITPVRFLDAQERLYGAIRTRLVSLCLTGKKPTFGHCGAFSEKVPFHTGFIGISDISLPSLAMPESVTMFDDVCVKIYDVCGQRTWYGILTLIENDIE